MSRTDLDDLEQTQDLTQTEAARLADFICLLGRLQKELRGKTLVLVLDEMERLMSIADKVKEMQASSLEVQSAIERVAEISEKNRENVEKVNRSTHEVGQRIEELSALAQSLDSTKK